MLKCTSLKNSRSPACLTKAFIGLAAMFGASTSIAAAPNVTFHDIAENDGAGIKYRQGATPAENMVEFHRAKPIYYMSDSPLYPGKPFGNPGISLFDYDNDGDIDMYVTNSNSGDGIRPKAPSSLYQNQLKETGQATFKDVAKAAGVEAPTQYSTGTCFGDTDNDGDKDLLILGARAIVFYENKGNGKFADKSLPAGFGMTNRHSISCSFGDVNGDGLVDVAVANSYDNWDHRLPLMLFEYGHMKQQNQLYLNKGGNKFEDVSKAAGVVLPEARITWGIALVDIDQDGDVDWVAAEDQGPTRPAVNGGKDVGYMRIFRNNGMGKFTDVTKEAGTDRYGAWMGVSFGDYNGDGNMDMHTTNAGQYLTLVMSDMTGGGDWGSGWFLGTGNGHFAYPNTGAVGFTPFGWGTATVDYDNDGMQDIIYAGGLDMATLVDSNPGAVLHNDGSANFTLDKVALPTDAYHVRRNIQGVAAGDLNGDGFVDIATVSEMNWPTEAPLVRYVDLIGPTGGQFDDVATFWPTFSPVDGTDLSKGFTWNHIRPIDGTMAVFMSSANNGNHSVTVTTLGTKGLVSHGKVNRDGFGAVVKFSPGAGKLPAMSPVVSGGSHSSSHSVDLVFGLGQSNAGTVDVLWPGGTRNRIYEVNQGEHLVIPEIPCSYNAKVKSESYRECVSEALEDLRHRDVVDRNYASRLFNSAMLAYKDAHR